MATLALLPYDPTSPVQVRAEARDGGGAVLEVVLVGRRDGPRPIEIPAGGSVVLTLEPEP